MITYFYNAEHENRQPSPSPQPEIEWQKIYFALHTVDVKVSRSTNNSDVSHLKADHDKVGRAVIRGIPGRITHEFIVEKIRCSSSVDELDANSDQTNSRFAVRIPGRVCNISEQYGWKKRSMYACNAAQMMSVLRIVPDVHQTGIEKSH